MFVFVAKNYLRDDARMERDEVIESKKKALKAAIDELDEETIDKLLDILHT